MKLEDQLCILYQSKKLKELGIDQTTQWYWGYPAHDKLISSKTGVIHTSITSDYLSDNEGDEFDHVIAAAYSVAELGVMLPSGYDTMRLTDEGWVGYDYNNEFLLGDARFETEAQCRAEMLIQLISVKEITPEECSKRLTE